jgi:hypothetical protein
MILVASCVGQLWQTVVSSIEDGTGGVLFRQNVPVPGVELEGVDFRLVLRPNHDVG